MWQDAVGFCRSVSVLEGISGRLWEKQGEEHGGKSWVSEEQEGIPSLHLTAEGMGKGGKEAAAPTMLCEMFPNLSVMEGPELAVCGSKVLLGITVSRDVPRALGDLGSHPCELHAHKEGTAGASRHPW